MPKKDVVRSNSQLPPARPSKATAAPTRPSSPIKSTQLNGTAITHSAIGIEIQPPRATAAPTVLSVSADLHARIQTDTRTTVSTAAAAIEERWTPLLIAVSDGCYERVAELLASGADANEYEPKSGLFPLHMAVDWGHTSIVTLLLQKVPGIDINAASIRCGESALHIAADSSQIETVRCLLAHHATADHLDNKQCTPMHLAAASGCLTTVQLLHERGASLESCTKQGIRPLHCAAKQGHLHLVHWLVQSGASVHTKDAKGRTVLYFGIGSRQEDIVRALLDYGATLGTDASRLLELAINKGKKEKALALINVMTVPAECGALLAVAASQPTPVYFNALLRAGATPDAVDAKGYNALHLAAEKGTYAAVELLLPRIAHPHCLTRRGESAVHIAVRYKRIDLVRLLVYHGVVGKCSSGWTAEQMAARNGFLEGFRLLFDDKWCTHTCLVLASQAGHLQIVQEIFKLAQGKDYWLSQYIAANANGETGMHVAAENGHLLIVQEFISRRMRVDTVDKEGETAFEAACRCKQLSVMQYLYNVGANCNRTKRNGETVLFTAVAASHLDVVATLLKMGVNLETRVKGNTAVQAAASQFDLPMIRLLLLSHPNLNAASADGTTPVCTAVNGNNVEMLRLLLQSGARPNAMCAGGQTALCMAAQKASLEMVEILVEAGACVQLMDANGKFPLEEAVTAKSLETVEYLLAAGASGIQAGLAIALEGYNLAIVVRLCQAAPGVRLPTGAIVEIMKKTPTSLDAQRSHPQILATLLASGYTEALLHTSWI
jgi:ankyrin